MALFSFRHSVKTFSEKRTAAVRAAQRGQTAAHLRYITRPQAARVVLRERLGGSDAEAAAEAERAALARKGRVCERFIVALPVEATDDQRQALVRAFAERFTQGIAGYVAAIHDTQGNDRWNPHFHLVAFDAHLRGGGRGRPRSVLGMARKNAVEDAAETWVELHNAMMRGWGYEPASMIDHRSLADRGIERIPTIHEGPAARAMAAKGLAPEAKPAWRGVDAGHTRAEANRVIREINLITEKADEGDDRLGRDDGGHGAQRESGGAERRADRGRGGPGPGSAAPPFVGTRGDQEEPAPDRGASAVPPFAAASPRESRAATRSPFPGLGLGWGVRRRRGVRRVFRELILLRDTLRARLLRARSLTHADQSARAFAAAMAARRSDRGHRDEEPTLDGLGKSPRSMSR